MSGPGIPPHPPQPSSQLGDYRVGGMVSEGAWTRTYEAEQISVRRQVLLERIKPGEEENEEVIEAFLADVRAKAAVDHPVIGSVYEAVRNGKLVFYTRELLQGRSLEELHEAGEQLDPREVATLLGQLGDAIHYMQERGVASLPLHPRHLVLGNHGVLRMVNLAVGGRMDPAVEALDRNLVCEVFSDLLAPGRPGSTRLRKLLTMLGSDAPPGWDRIGHTGRKLAHELSEGAKSISQPEAPAPQPEPERSRGTGVLRPLLAGLLVLSALVAGGVYFLNRPRIPRARVLDQMIEITGATATGPGSVKVPIPAYWIDAHEVTIAEYATFLKALAMIDEDRRNAYDHRDQPKGKDGHEPEDWAAMLAASESGGFWNALPITPNCPVVNVDWWDAYAYAGWRGGRLPTLEEWLAAAEGTAPRTSGWGEVDAAVPDQTPSGIHGLAGNVSEWVRDPGHNPAFPMNPRAPVACGASYRHPRNGILACTWLESRDQKQADLGFRIVREAKP